MIIIDKVYGKFEVEGIFEELINSKAIQRLKGIHQGGANFLVNPKWNVTRYDHSIGTMLLIRMLGGSIEEQIGGLLHDISHTAFSHVIDYALGYKGEDYHEKIFRELIEKSDIPDILIRNGYDYKDILYNEKKWTILEKSAPKLCADRVDYTLRDMFNNGVISGKDLEEFLRDLTVVNGEIVIKTIKSGEWFVETYYKEVIDYFMDPLSVYSDDRVAKAIKLALEEGNISLDDLLENDEYVLKKLKKSRNDEVLNLLDSLKRQVVIVDCKCDFDIYQKQKLRIIDPTLYIQGAFYKTSDKSERVKLMTKEAMKKSEEGVYIKILN